MGHIGLTPQSVGALGGYKIQGKSCMSSLLELCLVDAVMKLIEDAKALEDAGCFSVVIECVPELVGEIITKSIHIPTIGIGAGAMCSGQVLVYHDMLGLLDHPLKPKVGLNHIDGSKWNNSLMDRVPHHSANSMPTLQRWFTKLLLITTGMWRKEDSPSLRIALIRLPTVTRRSFCSSLRRSPTLLELNRMWWRAKSLNSINSYLYFYSVSLSHLTKDICQRLFQTYGYFCNRKGSTLLEQGCDRAGIGYAEARRLCWYCGSLARSWYLVRTTINGLEGRCSQSSFAREEPNYHRVPQHLPECHCMTLLHW